MPLSLGRSPEQVLRRCRRGSLSLRQSPCARHESRTVLSKVWQPLRLRAGATSGSGAGLGGRRSPAFGSTERRGESANCHAARRGSQPQNEGDENWLRGEFELQHADHRGARLCGNRQTPAGLRPRVRSTRAPAVRSLRDGIQRSLAVSDNVRKRSSSTHERAETSLLQGDRASSSRQWPRSRKSPPGLDAAPCPASGCPASGRLPADRPTARRVFATRIRHAIRPCAHRAVRCTP